MKILVISEIVYREGGGAELATYLILKILSKEGFKITVLTSTRNPEPIPGVSYYTTSLLKPLDRVRRFFNVEMLKRQEWFRKLLKSHDILYIPQAAYNLIPQAKKLGLKIIVHLHNYTPIRWHGVVYYFEPERPTLMQELKVAIYNEVHQHGDPKRLLGLPASYLIYLVTKQTLKEADYIICVSRRQAGIILKQIPELAEKIRVIYNPLPNIPKTNLAKSKKPTLLYSGGDNYIKGFQTLLEALPKIMKYNKNVEVILTGRYGKTTEVLKQISKSVDKRIELLGYVSRNKLLNLCAKSWATIVPSIWEEPLPYVVMESMILGTIPIASKIGGIPEIVNGTPAERFLCSPNDPTELIERLNEVTAMDRKDLEQIGYKLQRQTEKKFNPIRVMKDILKVLWN